MTKEEFIQGCMECLKSSQDVAESKFNSLLLSGGVDLETADRSTVKAAVRAFLNSEADQFLPFSYSGCVECKKMAREFEDLM